MKITKFDCNFKSKIHNTVKLPTIGRYLYTNMQIVCLNSIINCHYKTIITVIRTI